LAEKNRISLASSEYPAFVHPVLVRNSWISMANITDYGMPRPPNRVFKNQTRATRIEGLVMNSNNLFQRTVRQLRCRLLTSVVGRTQSSEPMRYDRRMASNTLQGLEND